MATLLTQTYNLNLIPGQNIVVVNAAAYDNSPRLIRFNMFNGAVAADVSGWSARVEGTRQGTKEGFSTVCTVASPVVSFAITNAMTASSGKHQAAVVFYQGEERVASATFILNVAPAVLDESTPATEEDATIYQQWLTANTSQIQANANDIAVLKGRMDEFASLPPGSTEGNAELVDIRVGADGTTYPTAGDAVRNQVTDLKTAIDDIAPTIADASAQLFNYENATILSGIYINIANAITVSSNSKHVTLLIPLTTATARSLTIHRGTTTSKFYIGIASTTTIEGGESLSYASDETSNSTVTLTYPTTAKALLINFINTNSGDSLDDVDPFIQSLMVEWGDEYSGYQEYGAWIPKDIPTVAEVDAKVNLQYTDTKMIQLGSELLTADGYWDSGWSGNNTDGYTHATGNSGSLTFNLGTVAEDDVFLVEFDTSYTSGEFLSVGIGSMYKILVYNGTSHIVVPVKSDGSNKLRFAPYDNIAFTISNVSCKKIVESGTDKTLSLKSILTLPNNANYGFWNVIFGKESMANSVGSTRCVSIGYQALNSLEGGHRNVGVGTFAMSQLVGGECNISIGSDSMLSATGANNCVAIGFGAMHNGTALESNVAIGYRAFYGTNASTAESNTVVGARAGFYTVGDGNTFAGFEAGFSVTSGEYNVAVGEGAKGASTGNGNVAVGHDSGYSDGVSHSIAIGENATASASNQMVLGDGSISDVIIAGKRITFHEDGSVTWATV